MCYENRGSKMNILRVLTISIWVLTAESLDLSTITQSEIGKIFGDNNCIEEDVFSIENRQTPFLEPTQTVNVKEHLQLEQEIDDWLNQKNGVSLINELAQFNGIQHVYEQIGVANNKFVMNLKLGDEEYESEGTSMKNAKQAVSDEALMFTKYKHPPIADPTEELNKLAENYGENVNYGEEKLEGNSFIANLLIGGIEFLGKGFSLENARRNAAIQALQNFPSLKVPQDKSPISIVYEWGVKYGVEVRLEVVSESGPPHRKLFVAECEINGIVTEAEGKSKKIAKRGAAEKMVPNLHSFNKTPVSYKTKRNKKKKKSIKINTNSFNPIKNGMKMVQNLAKNPIGTIAKQVLGSTNQGTTKNRNYLSKISTIIENVNTTIPLIKIGDTISNTMETVKNYLKTDKPKSQLKVKPSGKKNGFSSANREELIKISKLLELKVEFLSIPKKDDEMFMSLLSLGTDRSYVCRGSGPSLTEANDNAALFGLDLVAEMGLHDNVVVLEKNQENGNGQVNIDLEKTKS